MLKWFVKKINNKKGFTLVELVVVIAILGILAAVAVPRLSGSQMKATVAAHNANVRTLESAANLYVADGGAATEWTGKDSESWKNWVQDWPVVPASLVGKETTISEAKADTEPVEYEIKTGTIAEGDIFRVKIEANGGVTVTPGKVAE